MAQAPHPAGAAAANFVGQIVTDPKNVPDVIMLYGYLGASSEEACERLYLSPDLSNYVEVPSSAILHRAAAAKEQDPHGGVTLWVKKDAALKYKMTPAQAAAQQALAYYFAGAIQAGAAATPPIPARTIVPECVPPTLADPQCPVTVPEPCPTRFATCQTRCVTCAPQQCTEASCGCTQQTPCSLATCAWVCTLGPACPTHGATCPPHATCAPQCTHATCPPVCTLSTCPPLCTHATCAPQCTQRTPCPRVSCGIDCTIVGCPTPVAPCPTHPPQATCAPLCTGAPCRPTFNQPGCPFPTEICTFVAGCRTQQPGVCPLPQAFAAAAAPQTLADCGPQTLGECGPPTLADPGCTFDQCVSQFGTCADTICCATANCTFDPCVSQFGTCPDTICCPTAVCLTPNCPTANCTFGCPPSVFGTCLPAATCAPGCTQICTIHVTCNPGCRPTNPAVCQIASAACPIASAAACPPPQSVECGSLGCGPGAGPVQQAQFCIAGSVRPPQLTPGCPTLAGCESLACPSWQYSCGWGCPPRTPQCPW